MLALHRRGAEGGGVMATALWIGVVPYDAHAKRWLDDVGKHYLQNAPPGALFAIGVRSAEPGLCGETIGTGPLLGLCVVGRPIAPRLPQNGSVGEITRMVLVPGLPHGTASQVIGGAITLAAARGLSTLIAYHDRTRHTGCIYRKAGFRRDGGTRATAGLWGSRPGRKSAAYAPAAKRRWRFDLVARPA